MLKLQNALPQINKDVHIPVLRQTAKGFPDIFIPSAHLYIMPCPRSLESPNGSSSTAFSTTLGFPIQSKNILQCLIISDT